MVLKNKKPSNIWYNWKTLENSGLDESLTKWE
jgi:hypothetical protein